eukprot:31811-Eustigmatos_ZCMA.PRE.1
MPAHGGRIPYGMTWTYLSHLTLDRWHGKHVLTHVEGLSMVWRPSAAPVVWSAGKASNAWRQWRHVRYKRHKEPSVTVEDAVAHGSSPPRGAAGALKGREQTVIMPA